MDEVVYLNARIIRVDVVKMRFIGQIMTAEPVLQLLLH